MMPLPGDLFAVTNPAETLRERFLFGLVTWGTKSRLVHCGIYVGTAFGHSQPQVIEAVPQGVSFRPYVDYMDAFWSTDRIDLTDDQRNKIVEFAGHCVGMKYGSRSLIPTALAQQRMGSWISPWKPIEQQPSWVRKFISENAFYCAEIVVRCYSYAGIQMFPWLSSTGDLIRAIGVNEFEGNAFSARRRFRDPNSWHWLSGRQNMGRVSRRS